MEIKNNKITIEQALTNLNTTIESFLHVNGMNDQYSRGKFKINPEKKSLEWNGAFANSRFTKTIALLLLMFTDDNKYSNVIFQSDGFSIYMNIDRRNDSTFESTDENLGFDYSDEYYIQQINKTIEYINNNKYFTIN